MNKAVEAETVESGHPGSPGAAFADFFAEGYPRLVRALLPATGDLASAEEAAQEAMTRAFARWGRVGRLDSPLGYAYVSRSTSIAAAHGDAGRRSTARRPICGPAPSGR